VRRAQSLRRVGFLYLVVLSALALAATLAWPLGFDHGIFAQNGWTVRQGGLPYRDAFELRGPLAFYLFAAIELAFGHSELAVRLADVIFIVGAAALVASAVRRGASRTAGAMAGGLWILAIVSQAPNDTAQPDLWVGAAVLASALVAAGDAPQRRWAMLGAGCIAAMPAMLKPFYLALVAVPIAALLARPATPEASRSRDLTLLLLGWAAPLFAMGLWLWHQGILSAFVEAHLLYSARVYATLAAPTWYERIEGVIRYLTETRLITVALPAAIAGSAALWPRSRSLAAALIAAVGVTTMCVGLQGRFFPYHWGPMLPSLAALAGVGISAALDDPSAAARSGSRARLLAVALLGVTVFVASVRPLVYVWHWVSFVTGRHSAETYLSRFADQWAVNPADQRRVAALLQGRTREGAVIGLWGDDAGVAYLAKRPLASRFPVTRYLEIAASSDITQRFRAEYLRGIETCRPEYFVIGRHVNLRGDPHRVPVQEQFPALHELLSRDYEADTVIGSIEVLRRRSAGQNAGPSSSAFSTSLSNARHHPRNVGSFPNSTTWPAPSGSSTTSAAPRISRSVLPGHWKPARWNAPRAGNTATLVPSRDRRKKVFPVTSAVSRGAS
jgi:hypothetical protein